MQALKTLLILLIFSNVSSQEKWKSLINNNNLNNWEIKQGSAEFVLENGVISATSILNTPSTYLGTKKQYDDFILEFEVFVDEGLNSGVQFRSSSNDNVPEHSRVYGYQFELDTNKYRNYKIF